MISKDVEDFNTMNQLDLTDIYRTVPLRENIHPSETHMDHYPGQTICSAIKQVNKFFKLEISKLKL